MLSVRDGGNSKLNENSPAITKPWEWGMCLKKRHLNGRAVNLPGISGLSASMQYLSLSMQVPLTHLSPVWKRLSVHRCTPKAVIYSFLYFYKFCLTLNLAQTTVTSEKCVKGSRLCLQLQSTEYSKYHCRTHLPTLTSVVNEVQAKILQQVALYISCTT